MEEGKSNTYTGEKGNSDAEKPLLFVIGGPGSGKGTQCEYITRDYGFIHYSAGDLLRAEVKSGTERGLEIKKAMDEGKLVNSKWTIDLLEKAIKTAPSSAKGYLIDGFPRDTVHGPLFEKQVRPCDLVLVLECSEETMMKRILEGRVVASGRSDDNEATVKKRFVVYNEQSLPVVEQYEKQGKIARVNAERVKDEVYADIKEILKKNNINITN